MVGEPCRAESFGLSRDAMAANRTLQLGLLVAAAAALGCAKATVRPADVGAGWAIPQPAEAWVYPFALTPGEISVNSGVFSRVADYVDESRVADQQMAAARDIQAAMTRDVVAGIQQLGLAARPATYDGPPPPPNTLLVEGQFLRVEEGNELRRVVVGFGLGQSRVRAQVQVYEVTPTKADYEHTREGRQLLLSFSIDSHSGETPGAAVGLAGGPIGGGVAAVRAVSEVAYEGKKSSATRDAGIAAKQVVAYLSQYMGKQGWISADEIQKVNVSP
jgi:Domain of unknown function (DUF4410)